MASKSEGPQSERFKALANILTRAREDAYARIHQLRGDQQDDVTAEPGDELDVARSLEEVETHAGLIEREENRLKAIDEATSRLERGLYGICEECGTEIPIARLKAVPFATRCVECETTRGAGRRQGAGSVDEPSRHRWNPPQELDESLETQDSQNEPEEGLEVHDRSPFGPEVGEFEQLPPAPTSRRRGRVKEQK